MDFSVSRRCAGALLSALFFNAAFLAAEEGSAESFVAELRPFPVKESLGLYNEPALGLATPVTPLRFAPGIDLQSRGYPELQSDLTLRGSTFEQTGIVIGTVPLFDPQTGHYAAELPFSGEMLRPPSLVQGVENAIRGMNANVGSIQFGWAQIDTRGKLVLGAGTDALVFGELYQGHAIGGSGWAYDLSIGHGQGDGTVEDGDFEVWRAAARLQHRSVRSQTDLALGWLDKFYGWPGLYTGFASLPETDDYQNLVFLANHRHQLGGESFWAMGAVYREMEDDYYFDRRTPPEERTSLFQHATRVGAVSGELHFALSDGWALIGRSVLMRDELRDSTSLRTGDPETGNDFTRRAYYKGVIAAEYERGERSEGQDRFRFGLAAVGTDQDGGRVSPLVSWERLKSAGGGDLAMRVSYTENSQVPGYTALRSAPSGLFGGNPNLGRELSRIGELALSWESEAWRLKGAVFRRKDRDLVDWTFSDDAPNARQANPLDLETDGIEIQAQHLGDWGELRLSYAWLRKDASYGDTLVDGSYYVLNFPIHRVTMGTRWLLAEGVEFGAEGAFRVAEDNPRRATSNESLTLSLAIRWQRGLAPGLEINLLLDNVLDDDFQTFPGSPGIGRHGSIRAVYRW